MIRALIFFCITGATLACSASTNVVLPPSTVKTNAVSYDLASGATVVKDSVTALFYLVAGTIAILSYLQARKTLFAPIRTETYKLQLKALEDVLFFFEKHTSLHIDGEFDYEKIVKLNACKMIDAYVLTFFEKNIKDKGAFEKHREEEYKDLVGATISQKFFESNFELYDKHIASDPPQPAIPSSPALILAKWQAYEHGMVEFTKKYQQATTKLQKFQVSPLLPKELKELIGNFEQQTRGNLMLVGDVLTALAKQLPEKYPNIDALKKMQLAWVWNAYNDKYARLEGKQKEILNYLGDYFQIENLLVKDSHR